MMQFNQLVWRQATTFEDIQRQPAILTGREFDAQRSRRSMLGKHGGTHQPADCSTGYGRMF